MKTNVESNFKCGEKDLACSACGIEIETQMHLLCCKVLIQQQPESTYDKKYKMIWTKCKWNLLYIKHFREQNDHIIHKIQTKTKMY